MNILSGILQDAYLICNIMTGAPVNPEAMWTMMNQLRNRILKMLEEGSIKDAKEKEKLSSYPLI